MRKLYEITLEEAFEILNLFQNNAFKDSNIQDWCFVDCSDGYSKMFMLKSESEKWDEDRELVMTINWLIDSIHIRNEVRYLSLGNYHKVIEYLKNKNFSLKWII